MRIYLAGSVPKGDAELADYTDWRAVYANEIRKTTPVELFDPNIFYALEGDSQAVTGADCLNVRDSDVVVVNAEQRLGAGTAMELVVAKYFNKPVITVLPRNSYHRRANIEFHGRVVADWIHPFVDTFSDVIIESASELSTALSEISKRSAKGINVIDSAIEYAKSKL